MQSGSEGERRERIPIVDGLFTWPSDEPRLVAGRCEACDTLAFPSWYQLHAPDCAGGPCEVLPLSRSGVLVSWTVQHFPPPPPFPAPDPFEPLAVGAVAFPEGIQILGQLSGEASDGLALGQQMVVVVEPLSVSDKGEDVLIWRFARASESSS